MNKLINLLQSMEKIFNSIIKARTGKLIESTAVVITKIKKKTLVSKYTRLSNFLVFCWKKKPKVFENVDLIGTS